MGDRKHDIHHYIYIPAEHPIYEGHEQLVRLLELGVTGEDPVQALPHLHLAAPGGHVPVNWIDGSGMF